MRNSPRCFYRLVAPVLSRNFPKYRCGPIVPSRQRFRRQFRAIASSGARGTPLSTGIRAQSRDQQDDRRNADARYSIRSLGISAVLDKLMTNMRARTYTRSLASPRARENPPRERLAFPFHHSHLHGEETSIKCDIYSGTKKRRRECSPTRHGMFSPSQNRNAILHASVRVTSRRRDSSRRFTSPDSSNILFAYKVPSFINRGGTVLA